MTARVNVLIGPAGCGKTGQLLSNYRQRLAEGDYGSTLWLTPTHRSVADTRHHLLDESLSQCLAPGVMTFERFAEAIVAAAPAETHRLGGLLKRQLLRRIIAEARAKGQLEHFGPIAHTRGFVDLVAELISEWKRVEVWPEDFARACGGGAMRAKDREVLALYAEYQRLLTAHELYDAEGSFWSARALLREGQRRPFERLRFVVVDGFTDFTRTQHEIMALLSAWVEEIAISLPGEEPLRRADLFAKPLSTLEQLHRYHPSLTVASQSRRATHQSGTVGHLEAELFGDPRQRPLADGAGIAVIAASGLRGEFAVVGRRIKQLLVEGDEGRRVRPGDVAVVVRSVSDVALLVEEVFHEFGIPYAIEASPKLADNSAIRALLALWRLDLEDWPFRSLIAMLTNNYFRPAWSGDQAGHASGLAEWAVRSLQISSGCARLLEALERHRRPDDVRLAEASATIRSRLEQEAAAHSCAAELLQPLAALFGRLPQSATPAQWSTALRGLIDETGLAGMAAASSDAAMQLTDVDALDQLLRAVASGDGLSERLGDEPPSLDRRELYELLLDVVRWEQVASVADETGRVRVLSAASVRALSVPYLFLASLTERSFPSPAREDRLYSESEYLQWRAAGLPVVLRAERSAEEMLLFYEVVTRSTRRLVLSYPAWDDKAEPLLPSPYVAEIDRIFGDSVERVTDQSLSPVPADERVCSAAQFRVRAVHDALHDQPQLLGKLLATPNQIALGDNLLAALNTTRLRRSQRGWSEFEGMVESEAARRWLKRRYGDSYTWTVSHLEQYATCPHQFFLERVVGLSPLGQLNLDEDFGQRGWMVHETLANLHRDLAATGRADERALAEQFLDSLDRLLATLSSEGLLGGLRKIDRLTLERVAHQYAEQQAKYATSCADIGGIEPSHFEVVFGLESTGDDVLSTSEPLVIEIADQTLRFAGRIDRVDLKQIGERTVFNVIDYKSGAAGVLKIDDVNAAALQLDLYTMAVESLLLAEQEALAWQAGYWRLRDKGFHKPLVLADVAGAQLAPSAAWRRRREEVGRLLLSLVRGIRAGQFPMHNDNHDCTGRCDFRTVCRVNHARALEKTWSPPETES